MLQCKVDADLIPRRTPRINALRRRRLGFFRRLRRLCFAFVPLGLLK